MWNKMLRQMNIGVKPSKTKPKMNSSEGTARNFYANSELLGFFLCFFSRFNQKRRTEKSTG
jgi:hypothetical protein